MATNSTFYKNVFQKAQPEQQAAFLEQLFSRDSSLRDQFDQFMDNWHKNKEEQPPTISFVNLNELAAEIRTALSDLQFDIESIYEHFHQGERSYVDQHEAAYEGAENMLKQIVFEPYAEQAENFLKKGNLLDGTKVLLALYEGHNNVYEPGYDEEDILDDYNGSCLELYQVHQHFALTDYTPHLNDTTAVCQSLDIIIERAALWESEYDESLQIDEWTDGNIVYDLQVFEPLFLAFIGRSKIVATHFKTVLMKNNLYHDLSDKVVEKLKTLV